MSNKLKNAIAYILQQYPFKNELSNARLTKIMYLTDWHQAINFNTQVTEINWYFDNYGPYVIDIMTEVNAHSELFGVQNTSNYYGNSKHILFIKDSNYIPSLSYENKVSLDYIIKITKSLHWDSFINLVYSTFPISTSERYSYLNLVKLAADYKNQRRKS